MIAFSLVALPVAIELNMTSPGVPWAPSKIIWRMKMDRNRAKAQDIRRRVAQVRVPIGIPKFIGNIEISNYGHGQSILLKRLDGPRIIEFGENIIFLEKNEW